MFKLLLLVAHLSGTPAFVVEVGLNYNSEAACQADSKRASEMLDFIFTAREDGNDFRVVSHICQRDV